jgi:hypothetical protein
MSRGNASFLSAILPHLPDGTATSRTAIMRAIIPIGDLGELARNALRMYSRSEHAGQWDGQALNSILASGQEHELAHGMDLACSGWSTKKPILIWRNWRSPYRTRVPLGHYASCSMVERQARRFGSRSGGLISAILIRPGTLFAVPSYAWSEHDDRRTLQVVKREGEIILSRFTIFEEMETVVPFEGARRVRVLTLSS